MRRMFEIKISVNLAAAINAHIVVGGWTRELADFDMLATWYVRLCLPRSYVVYTSAAYLPTYLSRVILAFIGP